MHVRVTNLVPMDVPVQCELFGDAEKTERLERLDLAIDALRGRFGNTCVKRAVELTDEVMSGLDIKRDNTIHPVVPQVGGRHGRRHLGRVKRYVSVTARMDEDGRVRPLSIQWYDGKTYPIDEVKDVRRASSRKVGGDGICYTIRIGNNVTYLFYEDPRWFVEEVVKDGMSA